MNSRKDLVHYLLERGLLEHRAVVDGDVAVAEVRRRHRNFVLLRQHGPGLFIKQMQPDQPMSAQTLQKEAAFYATVETDPTLVELRDLLPKFHAWDPDLHLLIVELLQGEDLNEHHRRLGMEFPVETARRVAIALARYHNASRRELASRPTGTMFMRQPPWILSFHNYPPGAMGQMSAANGQFVNMLQAYPDFGRALDALRNNWRFETLVHQDMKFENCMLIGDGVRFVDWELADIGDPLWDIGSILQAYLTWWLGSMIVPQGAPLVINADHATVPLAKMQPAMRELWSAYANECNLTNDAAALERVASFTGARMLQTVYEALAWSTSMTPQSVLQLQAAMNLLRQPRAAANELFGAPAHV